MLVNAFRELPYMSALVCTLSYFGIFVRRRKIKPRLLDYPILLRSCSYDYQVFGKVFLWKGYRNICTGDERFIIDAGANIGCSVCYFAVCAPQARIIAIEPEENNHHLLCRNTSRIAERVKYIDRPLSGTLERHGVDRSRNRPDGYRFVKDQSGVMISITIGEILRSVEWCDDIDVMKVDIEGGEYSVFLNGDISWLANVRYLVCEFHEDSRKQDAINKILEYGFLSRNFGEDTHFWRE